MLRRMGLWGELDCPRRAQVVWPRTEAKHGRRLPAVLRQVLGYLQRPGKREGSTRAAVVVGEFRSASVPWHLVEKQFLEPGVLLVQEAALDALVERHAHDWGIDLTVPEAEFTVSFTDQL